MENSYFENLLLKNRSYRGYDSQYIVSEEELVKIIAVNDKISSARNQQALRFKVVTSNEAHKVLNNIKLGMALPELQLPLKGTEPNAFIICCSSIAENNLLYTDLGISCQSMLLKAVEMGLNGICIGAFNEKNIIAEFSLLYKPLLILAIGKGNEKIQITHIKADDNHKYYRENGVHYVPKIGIKDLLL